MALKTVVVNVQPVAVHPYFSGQLSVTLKWEQQKLLAGHQGISSTLSWVTYTQKLFFWSLSMLFEIRKQPRHVYQDEKYNFMLYLST